MTWGKHNVNVIVYPLWQPTIINVSLTVQYQDTGFTESIYF